MFLTCIELMLQTMLLGIEAQAVIGLRLRKIADGGPAAIVEVHQMVMEKTTALAEAAATLGSGGSFRCVVRAAAHPCAGQRASAARRRLVTDMGVSAYRRF
jgi:hypothetical protein